ncbi:MAG: DoxX family protein [Candidatus Nanopelagicales bacterium]
MNIALWVVTILLLLVFLASGAMKIAQPKEKLGERLPWTEDFSAGQIKGIGAIEVLGALGLVLPAIGGIAPILVPVAATGLAIVMVVATIMHVRRGDPAAAAITTIVLALLSAFVAWGRFGPYPL